MPDPTAGGLIIEIVDFTGNGIFSVSGKTAGYLRPAVPDHMRDLLLAQREAAGAGGLVGGAVPGAANGHVAGGLVVGIVTFTANGIFSVSGKIARWR